MIKADRLSPWEIRCAMANSLATSLKKTKSLLNFAEARVFDVYGPQVHDLKWYFMPYDYIFYTDVLQKKGRTLSLTYPDIAAISRHQAPEIRCPGHASGCGSERHLARKINSSVCILLTKAIPKSSSSWLSCRSTRFLDIISFQTPLASI